MVSCHWTEAAQVGEWVAPRQPCAHHRLPLLVPEAECHLPFFTVPVFLLSHSWSLHSITFPSWLCVLLDFQSPKYMVFFKVPSVFKILPFCLKSSCSRPLTDMECLTWWFQCHVSWGNGASWWCFIESHLLLLFGWLTWSMEWKVMNWTGASFGFYSSKANSSNSPWLWLKLKSIGHMMTEKTRVRWTLDPGALMKALGSSSLHSVAIIFPFGSKNKLHLLDDCQWLKSLIVSSLSLVEKRVCFSSQRAH